MRLSVLWKLMLVSLIRKCKLLQLMSSAKKVNANLETVSSSTSSSLRSSEEHAISSTAPGSPPSSPRNVVEAKAVNAPKDHRASRSPLIQLIRSLS